MPFTVFPDLPTELRLQIWQHYFESPRIHVLHDAANADAGPDRVLLTCITIDAQTGIPLSPCIRTDINREARSAALSLNQPRERIRTLTKPIHRVFLFYPVEAQAAAASGPPQRPVDVHWANDLIYFCSPRSTFAFMTLAYRPWAHKVQNLAAAQPWPTFGDGLGVRMSFDGWPLYEAIKAMPALQEVSVVLVPPLEGEAATGSDTAGAVSSEAAKGTGGLKRTAFGFADFAEYMRQTWAGQLLKEGLEMTRMSLALRHTLEKLGTDSGVTLRKVVDVDCCRLQDGEYRRRRRNVL